MPEHCVAYSCSNRRTVKTKARGITFHKFPKKDMRKKWEDALQREAFTATDSSVICSEHFKPKDFDRTGQIVRLRDGVIPSIFNFPAHLQTRQKSRTTSTSKRAEKILSVASMDAQQTSTSHPQPQSNDLQKSRTTSTSKRAEESLCVASMDSQQTSTSHPQPQPDKDHCYALPDSPSSLKARLYEALARVEHLEKEKKNALDREKRAKTKVQSILGDLREKELLNEELQEKLEFYSDLKMDFMVRQGQEYTKEYKEFALTLHLHGPKAYKYLRETRNFPLPHPNTLQRWLCSGDNKP